ncbi:MAG: FtsW/RodA/SpoVE family cell cycle protein [Prevotella sp.]|nr:FtsW/RodA/SpoVE family cell cycle protein [Prevotella sp.]
MINKTLNNIFKGDKVIWMVFFFLCIISVIEVYSASSQLTYKDGSYLAPVLKHIGILLMGIFCMVITLNIKCKYFKIVTPFLLIVSFIMLLWALIGGDKTNEAARWVGFGFLKFQPSEIAKGTLVLATAQILSALQTEKGADRHAFGYILFVCAWIIPLILVENFSTAALLCVVIFMMMVLGRVPLQQLGKLLGVVVLFVALFIGVIMFFGKTEQPANPDQTLVQQVEQLNDDGTIQVQTEQEESAFKKIFHRFDTWKARIEKFFDRTEVSPAEFDLDKDGQVGHANIAIATSNIVGKGPGNSVERDFLSQAFSDFIYAIIIEETGIVGAIFVAMLYIILLFRTGRIANRCENNFPAFLAMGIALLLVTQALFNMCVAVGLAPVTGQPLPLISKGGTSTMINCMYIGVILSISRSAKKKIEESGVKE